MIGRSLVLALGCALALAGCEDGPAAYCEAPVQGAVGYARVRPVLDQHCVRCHAATLQGRARQGASLGVDFDTYEASAGGSNAQRALARARRRTMPPHSTISSEECSMIRAWVEAGAPR